MPTATISSYNYSVRDRTGKMVTGSLDAESPAMVAAKLKQLGYAPVSISAASGGLKREINIPGFGPKVKLKDLSIFARQFSTMLNSGLSLIRGLSILVDQTENKLLAKTLGQVRADVETGNALSTSMAKHPKIFPPLMVNMIKAGEVGGFLDQVMLQLAENFEAEVKLKSKIKSAMTYPTVVLCISLVAVMIMLIFISLGSKLPAPTQILVDVSHSMKIVIGPLILCLVGLKVLWGKYKLHPKVRDVVDPLKLRLPVFGELFRKVGLARFSRNLGTMLHSGVPILQSLDIVADTSGNVVIARAVRAVQESVRTGESLAQPLEAHAIFPPMVVQMMSVGEETGALDLMLHKIAHFYDQEVEAMTESLTALLEPLMIAFLGALVGSMIVCLYLPMFDIYKHIGS
ncbi:MAG: type II secretion system F family protein [Mycobacteriales bacterium]